MTDPLADLERLPGVDAAATEARSAVDRLLWDRGVRARMAEVVAGSRLQGAWASASIDGAELAPSAVRDGSALDGSAMGRVLAAAMRLQAEVPGQVEVFRRSPLQALARLHAVTAVGFVEPASSGRPRLDLVADDPLRLGPPPPPGEVTARLEALALLLTRPTAAPALVVAAVVHGELLALRPFAWGSGLLARASLRLVLAARGVDPDGAAVPEAGLLQHGRPAYVAAARGYLSATPEGLATWIRHSCAAVAAGAVAPPP